MKSILLLVVLAVTVLSLGCEDDGATSSPEQRLESNSYTVRGVVVSVPDGSAGGEFMVHHEAIPDFVRADGSKGMREMAMPFPPADPEMLEGIAKGDKVELTFESWWKPQAGMEMREIRKLPADTKLFDDAPATAPTAQTGHVGDCCPPDQS